MLAVGRLEERSGHSSIPGGKETAPRTRDRAAGGGPFHVQEDLRTDDMDVPPTIEPAHAFLLDVTPQAWGHVFSDENGDGTARSRPDEHFDALRQAAGVW